jgi:hypothetical protein
VRKEEGEIQRGWWMEESLKVILREEEGGRGNNRGR